MAATIAESKKLHIVMFPGLAFGHMIPYLELAKLIAQKGHTISFVSTSRNIDRLPKLPPNLKPLINFVKLPLTHMENLPEDAEATSDLPYNIVQYLFKALDSLQEPIKQFLESSKPDWVFYDFSYYWLGSIAAKSGAKCVFFSIAIPAAMAFFGPPSVLEGDEYRKTPEDFTISPKWVCFPTNVAYKYYAISKIFDNVETDVSGISALSRFGPCLKSCDLVVVRGCIELHGQWFQLLEKLHEKPVFPFGELPTKDNDQKNDDDDDD